jgi:hypothetical protein
MCNKLRGIGMFLNSKISFFVIIFSLIEGSTRVAAGEDLQQKEYLLTKQKYIKLENKENDRNGNVKLEPTRKSKQERLSERIDKLIQAFESYDTLSKQEQKVLRDEWKDEVKHLDSQVKEIKIKNHFAMHNMSKDLTIEEITIPKASLQKLIIIEEQYHRHCVIF